VQSMNAIALLTFEPTENQIRFYRRFKHEGYDVFIVVDNNNYARKDSGIKLIKIDDSLCASEGFVNLNPIITMKTQRSCSAWDKALYYFTKIDGAYQNIWFIEDDVFVPAVQTIVKMDRKYGEADIISNANTINKTGELESWYWYKFIPPERLPLPWASSMVCAVRLSRSLLRCVDSFLSLNKDFQSNEKEMVGSYLFIEYIFHTLALHNNLKVVVANELSGVVLHKSWQPQDINNDCLYHPLKTRFLHEVYRNTFARRMYHIAKMLNPVGLRRMIVDTIRSSS
jgi:hypothetical protein